MENQNILISGASVAGPALAWWLGRHGFRPTVVERAPRLRGGGYAVDFRGAAHLSVLAKMGILDQVRERQTHLSATTYVDADGRPVASMPAGIFAGDVEILRGDLGRILYEATRDGTEYLFGDSVTGLRQDAGGAHVTFARSAPRTFDLVIGADGLHSVVRALAFAGQPDQGLRVEGRIAALRQHRLQVLRRHRRQRRHHLWRGVENIDRREIAEHRHERQHAFDQKRRNSRHQPKFLRRRERRMTWHIGNAGSAVERIFGIVIPQFGR